ncbi:MAG: metal-sensitive transcriptional regulator [Rhizobacter sp.]|nr:metal-sensitive transcriptional regulator [Bacteriovorax sp.]
MKSKKISKVTAKKVVKKNKHEHSHPDHKGHLKQLARVKGQIDGIEKMINEGRYCVDIINQLKAVSAGIKVIESDIFDSHLKSCVREALSSDDDIDIQKKIEEINRLVYGKTKGKK